MTALRVAALAVVSLLLGISRVFAQDAEREKWRLVDGYWQFAITDSLDQPVQRGFLLINRDGVYSPTIWNENHAANNYIAQLALDGDVYVITVAWMWTRDEVRVRLAGSRVLRGTWRSSFNGTMYRVTMKQLVPEFNHVAVQHHSPNTVVLLVTGRVNMPIAWGPYGILGAAHVADPEITIRQVSMSDSATMRVQLNATDKAVPGRKRLTVNGATVDWTFGWQIAGELVSAPAVRSPAVGAAAAGGFGGGRKRPPR